MSSGTHDLSALADEVIGLIREERILDLDDEFGPGDDLFAAGLDSLALMQVLVAVSERFGVMVEAGEVTRENFRSAGAIAGVLHEGRLDRGGE